MLNAMRGYVKDNKIVTESELTKYEGMQLVVTFLGEEIPLSEKKSIDLSSYGHRTERGQNVDNYMKEMRVDDRF